MFGKVVKIYTNWKLVTDTIFSLDYFEIWNVLSSAEFFTLFSSLEKDDLMICKPILVKPKSLIIQ